MGPSGDGKVGVTDPDFSHFRRLAHSRSGLVLGPDKAYLIMGRLDPIARAEGLAGVPALLAKLRAEAPEALIQKCVHALATHESSFFRDGAPFEALMAQVLPRLIAARQPQRALRILCAACSSGQEVYSIAISLAELGAPLSGWRVEILGTDFSEPILLKAAAGLYSDFEVRRGLSPERLARWFTEERGAWRVSPRLRQVVSFKLHNLLEDSSALGLFDIVFCRNVLIYFDQTLKHQVLVDLGRLLRPDGAVFLGSAESIFGLGVGLEPIPGARGLFQKAVAARTIRTA